MTSFKSPIIVLAILCAVGVHMVLFTDAGHRLQSSAVDSIASSGADVKLDIESGVLAWELGRDISQAESISMNMSFNDESLVLTDAESLLGTLDEGSIDWGKRITLDFGTPKNLKKGTVLATWKAVGVLPEVHAINISDVTVTTTSGDESLSSEGTGEF